MTSTWTGGADVDEVTKVYEQIHAEEEAKAAKEGLDSKTLRANIRDRNRQIALRYGRAPDAGPAADESALRGAFREHLSGAELDLALGMADHDMAQADAAKLEIERTSFVADDDVLNNIFESQHKRARADTTRDLEVDLQQRRELDELRGRPWSPEDYRKQREELDRQVTDQSKVLAKTYMDDLGRRYDASYTTWSNRGLDDLITSNMSGYDKQKAQDLRARGYLEPEQEIYYAVQGAGTNVNTLRRVLDGKSKTEIEAIEKAWASKYPKQPPLRERISEDVSGRDEQDLGLLLEGKKETIEERLDLARRKLQYEQNAYALGGRFSSRERADMEDEVKRLERLQELMAASKDDPERAANLRWAFDQQERTVNAAVEQHRRSVDKLADSVAMVASIAAAVVVGVLTAGAGLVVAAGLAALAATEATILSKALLKGHAYSEEELLVDVVSGVVDVAASMATAGVGGALLRAGRAGQLGRLATMARSASMTRRVIAHGIAEGAEGMVSALPSALAGTLVDERTWREGDLTTNLLAGVGTAAAMGTVMSGTIGAFGGRARPDVHLPRLDPPGRAAEWLDYRARNPDADYATFLRDLETGAVKVDDSVGQQFDRQLRSSCWPASRRPSATPSATSPSTSSPTPTSSA